MDLYQTLQQDPNLAGIPAIFATGHNPTLIQTSRKLPPILSKPFRARQLLDQIADHLRRDNLLTAP